MKTLTKTISVLSLALAFFLTSFISFAEVNENKDKTFDPKKMSSGLTFDLDHMSQAPLNFRLDIRQPENHLVNVTIYDTNGKEVYSSFTSKTEISQLFNVSGLGYGEYTVEIATLGEVASDKIVLEKPEFMRPKAFIKESEKIKNKVTIVSLNTDSTVKIKIHDQDNKLVYYDSYFVNDYRDHLDLSFLPKGEYTISLESKNLSETQKVTVE
ncbi:DUF3244 domain-containing protein [Mangrovivirga sp. M17]|uniref:DUF3244 domain-containing protein n=1 Tax=Mangrovivirga halotolerans TaxID=2993936 RepID=A0ABT3RQ18_9BACT|nr:T9SS type A sorting domain-containing protein [Mangrovivirga halotolerans]MCX2743628.1 DUF3244 domain-containing protein [Mangrovivirga halotolerans]